MNNFMKSNENAISLIALIITIIVIIILAAVVIGSALSTPEQANFARFSSDFSEIESAVKTTYATEYGKVMMNNQNATKNQIYQAIALGTSDYSTITTTDKTVVPFLADSPTLGLTGIATPSYSNSSDWSINCETGEIIYTKGFEKDGVEYLTPGGTYTLAIGIYKLTVPAGFNVAKLNATTKNYEGQVMTLDEVKALTETDVNNGIVIVDGDGNEFVWVPCEVVENGATDTAVVNYSRYEFTSATEATAKAPTDVIKTYYTEPITGDNVDTRTLEAKESVKKYGGFYVGRYEAGSSVERKTSNDTLTKVLSKKNQYVYNYVTRDQAKSLSEEMYINSVGSKLISSFEWDTMLKWIQEINGANKNVYSSADWGNYYNCTAFNFTGKYWATGSSSYVDGNNISKPATGRWLLQTGVDTATVGRNMANNIYDIAGNVFERTTENSTYTYTNNGVTTACPCVARGGYFYVSASYFPASYRGFYTEAGSGFSHGFRLVLYVK